MSESAIDWYEVGKAERQLIEDALSLEGELITVECTTYSPTNKTAFTLKAVSNFREAVDRYSEAMERATKGKVAA